MCSLLYGSSTVSTYYKLSTDSSRLVVVYREFIILEECITEHYYAIHLQSKWILAPFQSSPIRAKLMMYKNVIIPWKKYRCATAFKHVQNSCGDDEPYTEWNSMQDMVVINGKLDFAVARMPFLNRNGQCISFFKRPNQSASQIATGCQQ